MNFYVGDYTRLGGPGVCVCALKGDQLSFLTAADVPVENPTYIILSRDQKTLYATSSSHSDGEDTGSVAVYDLSGDVPRLTGMHSTGGTSACHLTLSDDERFLYVANYQSGSLCVFPVEQGRLLPHIQLITHEGHGPNAARQEHAHVHFAAFHPEDHRLYAVDLGIDAVMIYRADPKTGLLTLDERVNVPAGMGPRHLLFHNDLMYVAHELGGAVSVFKRTHSEWVLEQTLSTLPDCWQGENTVAAIRLFRDRLYVSNRGHNSIAEFRVMDSGLLEKIRIFTVFGDFPCDFVVLDDGRLLVANQKSGDIRLLDPHGDTVHQIGSSLPIKGAVCICPLSVPDPLALTNQS